MLKSSSMEIRSTLKDWDKAAYRKMSRGRRLELAIELSEFVQKLGKGVKTHGKRIPGDSSVGWVALYNPTK